MAKLTPIAGEYSPEEKWQISGESGKRAFTDLVACVGFGLPDAPSADYQGHAFALMGLQADKRYNLIGEAIGPHGKMVKTLITWKDRVGFTTLYVPQRPESEFLHYAGANGLTYYRTLGVGREGQPLYADPPTTYPAFRSYTHTCAVAPIPEEIFADFPAFLAAYRSKVDSGHIIVADWCLRAVALASEGKRAVDHPLAKAIVACSAILDVSTSAAPARKEAAHNQWYANRL